MSELNKCLMDSQQISTPARVISQRITSHLPKEIITDILSRLPVKTLIRFKCVSKFFLHLILNPHFMNTHLIKSSNFANRNHPSLILSSSYDDCIYYLNSSSIDSILYSNSDVNKNNKIFKDYGTSLNFPLIKCGCRVMGSCNGLVCLNIAYQSIFMWNPSTRETKLLPDWGTKLRFQSNVDLFGFGYDHLNDDYKVVWMTPCIDPHTNDNIAIIYSLRTNSRRNFGNFPPFIRAPFNPGKLINGVLHWQVNNSQDDLSSTIIVSLDLGNEMYAEIAQPDYGDGDFSTSLSVLEGCLCICYNYDRIRDDIWVMKEYGNRNSWIKLYTIPYLTGHMKGWGDGTNYPLFITKTGELFLMNDCSFIMFYPNNGTFRNLIDYGMFGLRVETTYLESLVSPNIYEEREKHESRKYKKNYGKLAHYIERLKRENNELVVKNLESDSETVRAKIELSRVRKRNEEYELRVSQLEEENKLLHDKYEKLAVKFLSTSDGKNILD